MSKYGFLSVRLQEMALLVLRRVGLCGGQNQMCHLCLAKIELKKCAVGKIKNTEGSAMRVGSVAVQLKYGLYVGQLSKLAFQFMFKSSVWSLLCRLLGLLVTFRSYPKLALWNTKLSITTNVNLMN